MCAHANMIAWDVAKWTKQITKVKGVHLIKKIYIEHLLMLNIFNARFIENTEAKPVNKTDKTPGFTDLRF